MYFIHYFEINIINIMLHYLNRTASFSAAVIGFQALMLGLYCPRLKRLSGCPDECLSTLKMSHRVFKKYISCIHDGFF